jgi:hypothetical protein
MIYRYFKCANYASDVISAKRLHFANPREFNDPLESVVMFDRQRDSNGNTQYFDTVQYVGKPIDGLGLCCFSRSIDNYLLWSHYADSHKGVCLGFDFARYFIKGYDVGGAQLLQYDNTAFYFSDVYYEPMFFELPYWEHKATGDWSLSADEAIHAYAHKLEAWHYGVAPISWTCSHWGGKDESCHERSLPIRESFGKRSWTLHALAERLAAWPRSSSPQRPRSETGSPNLNVTLDYAATG